VAQPRTLVAITGASSGIGAAFARKLAPHYNLLLIARRKERLEQLAAELNEKYGAASEVLVADLTQEEDVDRAVKRIADAPDLVLLINNAGFGTPGPFWELPLQVHENMHRLHVLATVRLTHAALRNLVHRNTGGIINVASIAAFVRNAGNASYSATKNWMTSFTEGLYLDLQAAGSNVTVQALCPGFTYSEFHDNLPVSRHRLAGSGFWMTAEEVVDASIAGLHRRKLFVIPGWRYRIIAALFSKMPAALRLSVEGAVSRRRQHALKAERPPDKQISGAK